MHQEISNLRKSRLNYNCFSAKCRKEQMIAVLRLMHKQSPKILLAHADHFNFKQIFSMLNSDFQSILILLSLSVLKKLFESSDS
jgi:hypothetical protein